MKWYHINDDWKVIQKQLTHSQHTRVLVTAIIDDSVGFIHVRDALRMLSKINSLTLLRAVREIYFTPDKTNLHRLMFNLKQNKERIGL